MIPLVLLRVKLPVGFKGGMAERVSAYLNVNDRREGLIV